MDHTQAQQQFNDFLEGVKKMKQENPEEYRELVADMTEYYKTFGEALELYTRD